MKLLGTQKGFTLLEVMIAFAIIVMVVFVTIIAQTGSSASSSRNRNVIIATHLARNLINEQEIKIEDVAFDRLEKTHTENFPAPNDTFKWTITYEEVDFAPLTDLIAKQSAAQNEKAGGGGETDSQTAMLLKMFKEYLQKSVRRMKVTIEWPEGTGTSSQTFTQLLVNYDAEFNMAL